MALMCVVPRRRHAAAGPRLAVPAAAVAAGQPTTITWPSRRRRPAATPTQNGLQPATGAARVRQRQLFAARGLPPRNAPSPSTSGSTARRREGAVVDKFEDDGEALMLELRV